MAEERGVVVYEAKDGQEIKLSFDTIKRYLVQGHPEMVTDQEMMFFMGVCKSRGLNPFIKDAYLIKYSEGEGAAIVTSIDFFRKRAKAQRDCKGWRKGIIIERAGKVMDSNGLMLESDKLLGGWFEARPEGWSEPQRIEVNLKGYIKRKKDGTITKFWAPENQPSQIMKVAESQGLRTLWPDEFQQLYTPEEMGEADMFAQAERKGKRMVEMSPGEGSNGKAIYEIKDSPKGEPEKKEEAAQQPSEKQPPAEPPKEETLYDKLISARQLFKGLIMGNFKDIEKLPAEEFKAVKDKWEEGSKTGKYGIIKGAVWPLVEAQVVTSPLTQGEIQEIETDASSIEDKAFFAEATRYMEALEPATWKLVTRLCGIEGKDIKDLHREDRSMFLERCRVQLEKQNQG